MNSQKREKLEAAGFTVGSAEDFLDMPEEERKLLQLRLDLARRVRQRREQSGLTQKQLAARLRSSQSLVAEIEAPEPGASLALAFLAYFALGGELADLTGQDQEPTQPGERRSRPA
jgi:ribosome-binding protein aMBF1 (putative translation factor)